MPSEVPLEGRKQPWCPKKSESQSLLLSLNDHPTCTMHTSHDMNEADDRATLASERSHDSPRHAGAAATQQNVKVTVATGDAVTNVAGGHTHGVNAAGWPCRKGIHCSAASHE